MPPPGCGSVRHAASASAHRAWHFSCSISRELLMEVWSALAAHYETIKHLHLRGLFANDPKRGERLTAEAVGLYLDYSKNRVTDETLRLLLSLAEQSGLRDRIDAMFRGERINVTENRAVLHVALRAPKGSAIFL